MAKWEKMSSGGSSTVILGGNDDLMRMTLAVFGEAVFGADMHVFDEDIKDESESFCKQLMISSANLHVCLIFPKFVRTTKEI